MRRSTVPSIPIEVQQATWEALWDELLHPSAENVLPVEEARQDKTDEGSAPLHREADTAA